MVKIYEVLDLYEFILKLLSTRSNLIRLEDILRSFEDVKDIYFTGPFINHHSIHNLITCIKCLAVIKLKFCLGFSRKADISRPCACRGDSLSLRKLEKLIGQGINSPFPGVLANIARYEIFASGANL